MGHRAMLRPYGPCPMAMVHGSARMRSRSRSQVRVLINLVPRYRAILQLYRRAPRRPAGPAGGAARSNPPAAAGCAHCAPRLWLSQFDMKLRAGALRLSSAGFHRSCEGGLAGLSASPPHSHAAAQDLSLPINTRRGIADDAPRLPNHRP
eukprot:SAG31_NODE_8_length_42345_cov_10.980992_15_plen_150_part_00